MLSFGETWETACPVTYHSYQLNYAEKNNPIHKKELLTIVKVLKKWRSHLLGAHFVVFTDHRMLKYFQSQKEMLRQLVFKGPVHRTGKRLQLNWTEPQKTGLSVAVRASRDGRTAPNRTDKDRFESVRTPTVYSS
jgi:RNase H-like domain found in reverse transcriptase